MASDSSKVSVLFVCLGNICRSPMAEGVFRHLSKNHPRIDEIDSAGTGAYHTLDPPDSRTQSTLRTHGITDYTHGARQVMPLDMEAFDYIFAMDEWNLRDLEKIQRKAQAKGKFPRAKVMLFGDFAGDSAGFRRGEEVVDPYYGAEDGFERVYQQVAEYSKNFLLSLEKK